MTLRQDYSHNLLLNQLLNNMKKLISIVLFAFLPFSAIAEISGSIGAVSNYVWRGATQSDRSPAIQGSITAEANGLYATVWASQVDFGDDTTVEVDYQVGYTLGDTAGIDVGVLAYTYIGDETDFADDGKEAYLSVFAGPFFVTAWPVTTYKIIIQDTKKPPQREA